jgi:hypothetical protein
MAVQGKRCVGYMCFLAISKGDCKKKALTIHPYFLTQDMAPNPFE